MSKRVLCKFFANGACLKGEYCEFAHDWKAPPNNICTYYQKGACAYGSKCRYDHVKLPRSEQSVSFSSSSSAPPVLNMALGFQPEFSTIQTISDPFVPSSESAWIQSAEHFGIVDDSDVLESKFVTPADQAICSFAAVGNCPRGEKCPHIHGDLCSICGKNCLHPFRPEENEEHKRSCEKRQKHLNALKQSQDIECSVCLERVLSKATATERKFGLLSECNHPFCIGCIRNWRSSSPSSGMDVNSALRACPICRKLSYFVIPSVMWYFTDEEKQEIVDNYKSKLKSIDCKHFDFGSGSCPFGTSCFYKHAYRDGTLEEVALRHLGAADGNTVIAKEIRLSDFLSRMRI